MQSDGRSPEVECLDDNDAGKIPGDLCYVTSDRLKGGCAKQASLRRRWPQVTRYPGAKMSNSSVSGEL